MKQPVTIYEIFKEIQQQREIRKVLGNGSVTIRYKLFSARPCAHTFLTLGVWLPFTLSLFLSLPPPFPPQFFVLSVSLSLALFSFYFPSHTLSLLFLPPTLFLPTSLYLTHTHTHFLLSISLTLSLSLTLSHTHFPLSISLQHTFTFSINVIRLTINLYVNGMTRMRWPFVQL